MSTVAAPSAAAPAETAGAESVRAFGLWLGAIGFGALLVRLAGLRTTSGRLVLLSDSWFYHAQANLIADGHGFADPHAALRTGRIIASAVHPPLFPAVLSIASVFGGTSASAHRITACFVGVGTVVVIALLAREVAGARAGLLAGAIAALYPNLWMIDGALFSEDLAAGLVALALLFALRLRRNATVLNGVGLGVALALGALTRGEVLLLAPLLVVPLFFRPRDDDVARRRRMLVVACTALAVVLGPWLVRNLTGFSRPVLISTNGDQVVAVANCDSTYRGVLAGYWDFKCNGHGDITDEPKRSLAERDTGLQYLWDHRGRFVSYVMWARLGRVWDVYRPIDNAQFSETEGRDPLFARVGLGAYWACIGFGAYGLVLLRRRGVALWVLLVPAIVVTVTALYSYGNPRFRAIAEPSIVVLAAVGLLAAWDRLTRPREVVG